MRATLPLASLESATGLTAPRILTGEEIQQLRDEALWQRAQRTDVFAEVMVLFVIRTPRPIIGSRPGTAMVWSSMLVLIAAVVLVQNPLGRWIGFAPLPVATLAVLATIVMACAARVEWLKTWLYKVGDADTGQRAAPAGRGPT